MITLGTTFVGSAYAMSGGDKKKEQGPPINAGSKEEENFIQ
jgi:F-type H+-transporting ATPase subunit k